MRQEDTRPDLEEDAPLWAIVFRCAERYGSAEDSTRLGWLLSGMRSLGARLVIGTTTLRLTRGEMSEAEYATARPYLVADAVHVRRIFIEAYKITKEEEQNARKV